MYAIREGSKKVKARHFQLSLTAIIPSLRKENLESIQKFKGAASAMYR
jgi:hypothetical protein